jgi:plastocyanin
VATLTLGVLAGGGVTQAVEAQPAGGTDWGVVAGGQAPGGYDMNAYFPKALTVTQGDSVNFAFAGFHTVTFPAGQPLDALAPFVPQADGSLAGGPGLFPYPPGPPAMGPVAYDGSAPISSGVPQGEDDVFSLTFTRPGVYDYLCLIHPGQVGMVTVLPAGSRSPETPDQARARGTAEFQMVLGVIKGTVEGPPGVVSGRATAAGGAQVAGVAAGVSNAAGATVLRFLPESTTVKRGDVVVWTLADPFEIHTVTFTSGATPPEFTQIMPNPAGPPSITVPANAASPVGGTVYTGQGYVNSGVLNIGSSFALTFDAPPGTYEYLCLVHPDMKGTVTVTQ